jgi:putative Mg2+ transporter-C (MgtC) family protein
LVLGIIPAQELQLAFDLLVAAVLGGLIGLEREYQQRPAGLRTLILVSVGAALFAATAAYAFGAQSDGASRILANIIVGIGFLGSGAVLKNEDSVKGLTTAASIWAVAAIAIAVALNFYFLAIVAEVLVLVTLFVLRKFEEHIPPTNAPPKSKN